MKAILQINRVIVGLLFIFSGLVKANDPHGLSYKMHEFFEIWDMTQFNSWTLLSSIFMNAFEIIAGFALLIGWRIRLFSWLLLLLIIFFTFLTGYTYVTGKPTNCGCFGDCLPISSQVSFYKDVLLTLLIAIIFFYRGSIKPLFTEKISWVCMALVTLFSFTIQWYALNYLPFVDCLPFKKGNDIREKMKMPANAVPDSTVITFIYEKAGKKMEFTSDKFPADFNSEYKYIDRYDKIIRPGKNNQPPIKGFSLNNLETGVDETSTVLAQPYTILLFAENFSTPLSNWEKSFSAIYQEAGKKNIPISLVTSSPEEARKILTNTSFSTITIYTCDYTAIRTAARTNPCLYLLKSGTVSGKWSYKTMQQITTPLATIPTQPVLLPADTLQQQQP